MEMKDKKHFFKVRTRENDMKRKKNWRRRENEMERKIFANEEKKNIQ